MDSNKDYNENYNEDVDKQDDLDDFDKQKRGRRSKNDNDGRNHKCQTCGKCYLSYPALYTHIKNKHSSSNGVGNKLRGRIRNSAGDSESDYNATTLSYFKSSDKVGYVEDKEAVNIVVSAYEELFDLILTINKCTNNSENEKKSKITKKYSDPLQYPVIKEFNVKIKSNSKNNFIRDTDSVFCDEVFALYLLTVKDLTNPLYFKKIAKFIFLYWEHLNIIKRDELRTEEVKENNNGISDYHYTSINNAEDAPDVSNEFITEFLDTDNNLYDIDKETAIELTQNFCQWMYDSNFSCSKLTLIINNNNNN